MAGESSLRSLPAWYFTKAEIENKSPSRKEGIPKQIEDSLRYSYCSFIRLLGINLQLPPHIPFRAIVYCHRFYTQLSHIRNCRYVIACACLRIAIRRDSYVPVCDELYGDVKKQAFSILNFFDRDAITILNASNVGQTEEQVVETLTETGLIMNSCPDELLDKLATIIDKETIDLRNPEMRRLAQAFINDSLRTTLFLQYELQVIVAGAILTASKILKIRLLPSDWYFRFGISSSAPIIDFVMQLGNFYIKSNLGIGSEEVILENTDQAFAERPAADGLLGHTHHDQDFSQIIAMESDNMDIEEGELKPQQAAEASAAADAANDGWIYYTFDRNIHNINHPRYIHRDAPSRNDDYRFRRPHPRN